MEKNKVSLTAQLTAYARAYHAMHDDPKIFDDFLAYRIFTEEERTNLEQTWRILSSFLTLNAPRRAPTRQPP